MAFCPKFHVFVFFSLVAISHCQSTKTITVGGLTDSAPDSTVTAQASTTPVSDSYTDPATFKDKILNSTNFFRSQHNASALVWNETSAEIGQAWVTQCIWRHSGGPTGENLAMGYQNVTAAVDGWGNERANYDWDKPGFGENTGHFTELVWRNTTTVGCAAKDCTGINKNQGFLLACEYWPGGNVHIDGVPSSQQWDEYKDNVQKQIKKVKGDTVESDNGSNGGVVVSSWWSLVITAAAVLVCRSDILDALVILR